MICQPCDWHGASIAECALSARRGTSGAGEFMRGHAIGLVGRLYRDWRGSSLGQAQASILFLVLDLQIDNELEPERLSVQVAARENWSCALRRSRQCRH